PKVSGRSRFGVQACRCSLAAPAPCVRAECPHGPRRERAGAAAKLRTMSFGLSLEKIILIGVIAALIIGPDKLPQYAAGFAQLLNKVRDLLKGARVRMRDEIGPEFDDVDWRKLDPRQYDPRRIVREALLDDDPGIATRPAPAG